MRNVIASLLAAVLAAPASAEGWFQWGRSADHRSAAPVIGQELARIEHELVLDPFVTTKKAESGRALAVHYQAPVIDGDDLYLVVLSGTYPGREQRDSQVWNVRNVRLTGDALVTRWNYASDWKPVPTTYSFWEPVYHVALTADAVWALGRGGTIDRIRRTDGTLIRRFNPFGETVNTAIFSIGPPAIDANGNVYYSAIQPAQGFDDPLGSWLVKIAADGTISKATYESLTPEAPKGDDQCLATFATADLPWPPAVDAVPPRRRCGPQRPAINAAPAVGPDGAVYTVSRAHLGGRDSYLIAANPDLTPRWASSMRYRFNDGCDVTIPPSGTPGGCRAGATRGIDPADNMPGSGVVADDSTSSPVVTPDGKILYGAVSSYPYAQGHLMKFAADGSYEASYPFGWDLTPAIHEHDGTYSILMKENRYGGGAYCGGRNIPQTICPTNRTLNTPHDPTQYLITSLDPGLNVEWQFRSYETRSCGRQPDGTIACTDDHPNGFEWCINAIAVDSRGVVYANAEDGYLYAIGPDGKQRQRIFLRLALGAAYTPLSIGAGGRIFTQNDGRLFIVSGPAKRRAAGGR